MTCDKHITLYICLTNARLNLDSRLFRVYTTELSNSCLFYTELHVNLVNKLKTIFIHHSLGHFTKSTIINDVKLDAKLGTFLLKVSYHLRSLKVEQGNNNVIVSDEQKAHHHYKYQLEPLQTIDYKLNKLYEVSHTLFEIACSYEKQYRNYVREKKQKINLTQRMHRNLRISCMRSHPKVNV